VGLMYEMVYFHDILHHWILRDFSY
jgi:hypothetical protein